MPIIAAARGDTDHFLIRIAEVQWALMICVFATSHVPALLSLDIAGYEGRNVLLIAFLVIVVQISDVLQYVWGKLLGSHKIAPRLSPSKTVEGFAGGILDQQGKTNDRYVIYNYTAALFAQGAAELRQFIKLLGGDPATSEGLCGVGDQFVTTMGGRNVRAGRYVGSGVPFSEVRDVHMKGVTLEGVAAIKVVGAALKPLTERGVIAPEDFPFCRYLYQIIAEDAPLVMPWQKFFGGEK